MSIRVQVHGLEKIEKRFKELPRKLQQRTLRTAMRQGGNVFRKEIRKNIDQLTVNDDAKKKLKRALFVQVKLLRRNAGVLTRVRIRAPDRREEKEEDAYFWRWIEYGTAKRFREIEWHFDLVEISRKAVWDIRGLKFRRATTYSQVIRRIDKVAYTGFIAPQPFVRPAIDSGAAEAARVIEAAIRSGLEKAWQETAST